MLAKLRNINALLMILFFTLRFSDLHGQDIVSMDELQDMSLEELLNINVITASKDPQKISEVPSSITVITRSDIENWNARTIGDILRFIPGFFVENYVGNSFTVSARGFYPAGFSKSAFLLLVDGRPTNNIDAGKSNFLLTTRNIKQIEIIRGPGSALYGANAFLGVINVITLNTDDLTKDDKTGVYSDLSVGEYGILQTGINYGKKLDNGLNIYSGMDFSKQHEQVKSYYGFNKYVKSGLRSADNDKFNNVDYMLKASYNNFLISSGFNIQQSQYPLHFGQLYFVDKEEAENQYYFADMTFNDDLSENISYRIKSYINRNDFKEKLQDAHYGFIPPDTLLLTVDTLTRPNHLDETRIGAEGQINYHFSLGQISNKLITGIEVKNEQVTYFHAQDITATEGFQKKEFSNKTIGLFFQDKIEILTNMDFYLGGRFDHHSKYGNNFSPRLSSLYHNDNNGISIRVNYAEAFKAPSFHQLYNHKLEPNFIAPDDTAAMGDLKPEKLKSLDFGAKYSYRNLITSDITIYLVEARNELVNTVSTSQPNYYYNKVNTKSKSLGMEFTTRMDKEFTDLKISPFINLSYAQVKKDTDGRDSFFDFKGENQNYGSNLKYVSGLYISYQNYLYANFSYHYIPKDKEIGRPGSFSDMNIGWHNDNINFKIGIKNVLDQTYYESRSVQLKRYIWSKISLYID